MGFNAKADPAKSAGIARATAANNSAALTVALVNAGALKDVDAAQKHFWSFYLELVPELTGETSAPASAPASLPQTSTRAVATTPPADAAMQAAEQAAKDGGLVAGPGDFVITFGKKHKGKTVAAIHAEDPEYLTGNNTWDGLVKSRNDDVRAAVNEFLASIA